MKLEGVRIYMRESNENANGKEALEMLKTIRKTVTSGARSSNRQELRLQME